MSDASNFMETTRPVASPEGLDEPCAEWSCYIGPNGYGMATVAGVRDYAHRQSHRLFNGPIPAGFEVDHLCVNTRCVEPTHLEAVTPTENKRRSRSFAGQRARQTHCVHGHPFDSFNTYIAPNGTRKCMECRRQANRRAYERAAA